MLPGEEPVHLQPRVEMPAAQEVENHDLVHLEPPANLIESLGALLRRSHDGRSQRRQEIRGFAALLLVTPGFRLRRSAKTAHHGDHRRFRVSGLG